MTDSRATPPPPGETQPGGTPTSGGSGGAGDPGNELSISDQKTQPMPVPGKPTPDFTLPNYEILGKLGQGGMGAVYKARQLSLDRIVAIKVLPQNLAEDRSYAMRLVREGQVLAKISHPNVVTCIDLGEHAGILYVVMEYVEGESLEGCLQRRTTLPLDEALHYLKQSVIGLDHANAMGILHRDIKPGNMLLQRAVKGQTTIKVPGGHSMKIADMGLARFTQEAGDNTRLTQDGMTVGTPNFMSPEQALGEPLDLRTDIYALGITFYLMVTGKLPFAAKNTAAVLSKKLSERFEDLRTHMPALPPGASLLVQRMTARDKDNRYATYGDLLKDIENLERGRPLEAVILDDDDASMSLLPETKAALSAAGQSFTAMGTAKKREAFEKAETQKKSASGGAVFGVIAGAVFLAGLGAWMFLSGGAGAKPNKVDSDAGRTRTPEKFVAKSAAKTEAPVAERFKPFSLIVGRSPQGWTSENDPTYFGYEESSSALTLNKLNAWTSAYVPIEKDRYLLEVHIRTPQGADHCEVRFDCTDETYIAAGICLLPSDSSVTAYFERRKRSDHSMVMRAERKGGLSKDAQLVLQLEVKPESIHATISDVDLGSLAPDSGSIEPRRVRIAIENGFGEFGYLKVSPLEAFDE